MPLQYDVVQKYCSQGFPTKYIYSHYSQYCQTINAAILVYYKALRSGKTKFSRDEYEKVFGKFFVSEQALAELDEQAIIDCFEPSMQSRIKLEKLDGHLFKTFIENWTKKRGQLLDAQIKCGQIIRDHFMPVEKFEELTAKGAKLKQALAFLDKLETESHDKCADSNDVVIPYAEYHALHELLLEHPEKKARLRKKHAKISEQIIRIFNGQERERD